MLGLGVFLSVALLVSALVQVPAIQKYLVNTLVEQLQDQTGAEVSLDGVRARLLQTVELQGLYLGDLNGDTLLYCSEIGVDIQPWALLYQEISIREMRFIEGAIHLNRNAGESDFNFQFIVDAFTGQEDSSTTPSAWKYRIDDLQVNAITFFLKDEVEKQWITVHSGQISIQMNGPPTDFSQLDVSYLSFLHTDVIWNRKTVAAQASPKPPLAETGIPRIGMGLTVAKLLLKKCRIRYTENVFPGRTVGTFDPSDIDLEDLSLELNEFRLIEGQLGLSLLQLAFREQSGFQLQQMAGQLEGDSLRLQLENLSIRTNASRLDGSVEVRLHTQPTQFPGIELNLSAGDLAVAELRYFFPDVLIFGEDNPGLVHLAGRVSAAGNWLHASKLTISAPGLLLEGSAKVENYSVDSLRSIEVSLKELSGSYEALHELVPNVSIPPSAQRLGRILVQGRVSGRVQDLNLDSLVLSTESQTGFLIGGNIQNLLKPDSIRYVVEVFSLRTSYADIKSLLLEKIPPELAGISLIAYEGLLRGSLSEVGLNGLIRSAAGPLVAKFSAQFSAEDSLIRYKAFLASTGWDLGVLTIDSSGLGPIAFELDVEGKGVSLKTIEANISARVNSLMMNGYEFRDFGGVATFSEQKGTATIAMSDPNLAFSGTGEMDFRDSLPVFDISAVVDKADLLATNLLDRDLHIQLGIRLVGQGNRPGNFQGSAELSKIKLRSDRLVYEEDVVRIRAQRTDAFHHQLEIDSEVLQARLGGRYHLEELPASLLTFFQHYFTSGSELADLADTTAISDPALAVSRRIATQQWELEVHVKNADKLAKIIIPDLAYLDSAFISGSYDSENQRMEAHVKMPKLEYGSSSIENLAFHFSADSTHFSGNSTSDTAQFSASIIFPATRVVSRLQDQHIFMDVGIQGDSLHDRFSLSVDIAREDGLYSVHLDTSMIFEYEEWHIDERNRISFDSAFLAVDHLMFQKNEQEIQISSEFHENGQPPLRLDFFHFEVGEVNNLTANGSLQLAGEMNGVLTVYHLFDSPFFSSQIRIDEMKLNAEPLGNLYLNMELETLQQVISLYTRVDGVSNQFTAAGVYRLESGVLDARAEVSKLSMPFIQGFIPDLITDSQGEIQGAFTLSGPASLPLLDGNLKFNKVETRILATGTKYSTDSEELLLVGNTIRFSDFAFQDTLGNRAEMKGLIDYSKPENIRFDLDIATDRLQVLNTGLKDNPLYYGNIFLALNARLYGTSLRPELSVNARTLSGTRLVTIPLGEEDEIRQASYVIFGKPPDIIEERGLDIEISHQPAQGPVIQTNLKLEISSDAELEVVIDPISGDKVVCRGDADLSVAMGRSGEISVIGSYVIDKGSYEFSYQNLLKKKFSVQKGSRIDFPGDPLQAAIDITALYETRTSTYELISSQATTLSTEELQQARQKVPVRAILKLSGVLFQPLITFDILLPESRGGLISSAVDRKLNEIRLDESEMSKQVFGLLLFNSFLLSDRSAGLALSTSGGDAALGSLSNLITGQLNNLASQYVKGVDISLALDTYSPGEQGGLTNRVTDMQVGVSKQLLDDRLSLSMGGNMSLNNETNGSSQENETITQFAGDFVIEYKLTESGRYRVKVFSKSDYDILNGSNVNKTGIGLYYRESFDKLGEKRRARREAKSNRP